MRPVFAGLRSAAVCAALVSCSVPPDVVAIPVGAATSPWPNSSAKAPSRETVFRVHSGSLYDPCGTRIVVRGINEMAMSCQDRTGSVWLGEIGRTGANAVRLWVGQPGAVMPELDALLATCERQHLLAILTIHDPAGDWTTLPSIVNDWLSANVLPVLRNHQSHLVLEIADALGDDQVSDDAWVAGYTNAVQAVRATGLRMPLIAAAPSWGTRVSTVLERGKDVMAADPEQNLLLSVSTMQSPAGIYTDQVVTSLLATAADRRIPLIISGFSPLAVDCASPVAYQTILSESQLRSIGWLAWSWGAATNTACTANDMTDQGSYDRLKTWGIEVAVGSAQGIQATAARTQYLSSGTCP